MLGRRNIAIMVIVFTFPFSTVIFGHGNGIEITPVEQGERKTPLYQAEIIQRLKQFTDIHSALREKRVIYEKYHHGGVKDEEKLREYKTTDFFMAYESVRHWLADEVNLLQNEYRERQQEGKSTDEVVKKAGTLFVTAFNIVFSFWEGTDYDYNGWTAYPQYGKLACGVFLFRMMKALGVKFPEKIKTSAVVYRHRADPVWIWQAAPEEQIQAYTGVKMISNHQCDDGKRDGHLPCLVRRLASKEHESFFFAGVPCHVFLVTRDLYGTKRLFHALGTTEKLVVPDVKNLCESDDVFIAQWSKKDFEKWLLGFSTSTR